MSERSPHPPSAPNDHRGCYSCWVDACTKLDERRKPIIDKMKEAESHLKQDSVFNAQYGSWVQSWNSNQQAFRKLAEEGRAMQPQCPTRYSRFLGEMPESINGGANPHVLNPLEFATGAGLAKAGITTAAKPLQMLTSGVVNSQLNQVIY